MPLPNSLKIGIAVLVVALLVLGGFFAFLRDGDGGVQTTIIVGTSEGEKVVYEEDAGLPIVPTIAEVEGTTVSYVRWETDYKAVSDDYATYTVPTGNLKAELVGCGGPLKTLEFSITQTRDVGVWYDLTSLQLTADWIVSHAKDNGCPLEGDYTLRYTIAFTVQAEGIGELPTDSVTGVYETPITLSTGTITAVESTTFSSG